MLELRVVMGEGELVSCSPSLNRSLFDAARSGLGRFVSAKRAYDPEGILTPGQGIF